MGDAVGPWRMRAQKMPAGRAADGPRRCSPKHCPPAGPFARLARCPSRCSAWTAIAPQFRTIQRAREIGILSPIGWCLTLALVETPDWVWFEEVLAYDNARLPQALIATGLATQTLRLCRCRPENPSLADDAADDADRYFRPVGTTSFGELRKHPGTFDQQPVEATATIAACLTAWRADGDAEWKAVAAGAFLWFFGGNDLSVPLVDLETGSCRDGLHPDRANENRGGESVVSTCWHWPICASLRAPASTRRIRGASRHGT